MEWVLKTGIVLTSFLFMEFMAWFTHKYVMHGFLWSWHESHHIPHKNVLEKNDYFAVVFAVPAILTIVIGSEVSEVWFLMYVGYGITLYGIFYFIFHDVIVHRRVKFNYIFKGRYMRRLIRAHKIHHKTLGKHGAKAFGFLWAPAKYDAEKSPE